MHHNIQDHKVCGSTGDAAEQTFVDSDGSAGMVDLVERVEAVRRFLPCLTCDGQGWIRFCPDCTDGHPSVSKLVAMGMAVLKAIGQVSFDGGMPAVSAVMSQVVRPESFQGAAVIESVR